MNKRVLIDFAKRIRLRRHEMGITQQELAERSGFHVNYIGGIERAERNPSLASIISLGKALGCGAKDLIP